MSKKDREAFIRGYRDGYKDEPRMSCYAPYLRGHIFGKAFKLWNGQS